MVDGWFGWGQALIMKPHIKKVNGVWCCEGYRGNNPANAYWVWKTWEAVIKANHRIDPLKYSKPE